MTARLFAIITLAAFYTAQIITGFDSSRVQAVALLMHANIFHLALNAWTAWLVIPARAPRSWVTLAIGTALGILGIALSPTPTVGFSAAIYAMMGLRWHEVNSKANRVILAASLALCLALPHVAFVAHVVPFACGIACAWIWRKTAVLALSKLMDHETKKG